MSSKGKRRKLRIRLSIEVTYSGRRVGKQLGKVVQDEIQRILKPFSSFEQMIDIFGWLSGCLSVLVTYHHITNSHKLGILKQHIYCLTVSVGQESRYNLVTSSFLLQVSHRLL